MTATTAIPTGDAGTARPPVTRWRPGGRWVLALLLVELALLGAVNLLHFPLSVPAQRALTGETYLDMCSFCSAGEEHRILTAFGDAGRAAQLRLLISIDIAIPVISAVFGASALAYLSRRRWLLALPIGAMLLDFAENAAIADAVWRYPDPASGIAGVLSGLKALAYAATVIAIAGAAAAAWWRRRSRDRVVSSARPAGPAQRGRR